MFGFNKKKLAYRVNNLNKGKSYFFINTMSLNARVVHIIFDFSIVCFLLLFYSLCC